MENIQLGNDEALMLEQQAQLLLTARRVAMRWVDLLNQENESKDQVALAGRILALSVEVNNPLNGENVDDVSEISIEALGSSVGLRNSLKRIDINTVGDLLPLNYIEIVRRGIATRSYIKELKAKLGAIGVTLPEK